MASSSLISSGVTLTSDHYLNGFYKADRSHRKTSGRKELTGTELSYEDTRALKRAVKKLANFDFESATDLKSFKNTIKAFADTYNNTLSSTSSSDDDSVNRYAKKLKKMVQKYSDEFEDIGISIDKKGTLTVNDNLLEAATEDSLKTLFSTKDGSNFLKETKKLASSINNNSYNALYTQLTGNGGKLNITL